MIDTERVTEYLATVRAFADKVGKRADLEDRLEWLARFYDRELTGKAVTRLTKDFAPYSFGWTTFQGDRCVYNGGLIFHGSHDGGGDGSGPTYAVCLQPSDGWEIHS